MHERSEELLVAYLDGELDEGGRSEIEAWLAADPAARELMADLAESANLLRRAYDDVLHEAIPERLIAAARGETLPAKGAQILPFMARHPTPVEPAARPRRSWRNLPIAASIAGLLLGGGLSYLGLSQWLPGGNGGVNAPAVAAQAANDVWLDNAAGYFKLFASAGDNALIDVPPNGDPSQALQKISQNLPKAVRLPDLKPWGLNFRGARLVVVGGRPAAQLVYTTDNKAIGPLTLIIGSSVQPDIPPTYDHRQDVNLLYWRHQGRAYAIVGQANIGYLWGIANDVAWQLDAI
jgi:anti-sigma factor RsiW